MPSLQDTIARNQKKLIRGPGGQLSEETPESVTTLATQAGIQSPPTTAVGASALGLTPKQQDMVGSAAQKANALNVAATAAPNTNLSDALRRQQARTQMTGEEQQKTEKSASLQALGGLGDRVHNFIESQRAKLGQTTAQVQAAQQAQTAQGAQANMAELQPLLEQLAANPNDMNLQLQVNKALGYDVNRQLSSAEINDLYKSANESIAQSGAQAVQDTLTANDLIAQGDLGYDANQLSELLGVSPEAVGQMSVAQIRDQVNRILTDEYSTTGQIAEQAQSTQLGAAERGLARQASREASATGVRATEADMQNLDQQIANAENVSFGGKVMSIEQALSDDNISSTISDYLNAAPGSPQRAQLEQSEPQLVEFINRNQSVLQDAANALSAGAGQFQQVQQQNKQLVEGMDPNLAKVLAPQASELAAAAIDPSSNPLLAYMAQNPDAKHVLSDVKPEEAQELSTLNPVEVESLLAGGGKKWQQYKQDVQEATDATNRTQQALEQGNSDEVINQVFNGMYPGGYAKFQRDYDEETRTDWLGLPSNVGQFQRLGGDGTTAPTPQQLAQSYLSGISKPSLKDAINGRTTDVNPLQAPQVLVTSLDPTQKKLWRKLGDSVRDGQVDYDELSRGGFTYDELKTINLKAPAFRNSRDAVFHAMSDSFIDENFPDKKSDAATMQKAYNLLLNTRDKLVSRLTDAGGQGATVVKAFADKLSKLSDMLDNQKAKEKEEREAPMRAAAEAQAAKIKKDARHIAEQQSMAYSGKTVDERIANMYAAKKKPNPYATEKKKK